MVSGSQMFRFYIYWAGDLSSSFFLSGVFGIVYFPINANCFSLQVFGKSLREQSFEAEQRNWAPSQIVMKEKPRKRPRVPPIPATWAVGEAFS